MVKARAAPFGDDALVDDFENVITIGIPKFASQPHAFRGKTAVNPVLDDALGVEEDEGEQGPAAQQIERC
ncbi:MAG: hypothetical protein ACLPTZ_17820 [Beijerinckiaceae bacterium]